MSQQLRAASNGASAIAAEDLHVYYGDFRAVKNINLQFPTKVISPSDRLGHSMNGWFSAHFVQARCMFSDVNKSGLKANL